VAEIILIRHGQASFGKENYDLLSPLGERQCFELGKTHKGHLEPSRLVSGTLVRQQQSLSTWLDGFNHNSAKKVEPPSQKMANFNEFDTEDVIAVEFPEFESRENMMRYLMESDNPKKTFHKLYQKAVQKWVAGESNAYAESFQVFNDRVVTGLNSLIKTSEPGSATILFSSGGPIALCLQHALGLSSQHAFALNEALANSSVSRLVFNQSGKLNLSYFNGFAHLNFSNTQITYR
jgi:broad specificity phosphatase PhoE